MDGGGEGSFSVSRTNGDTSETFLPAVSNPPHGAFQPDLALGSHCLLPFPQALGSPELATAITYTLENKG